MKDLQHMYYFENLMNDANNELVREAKDAGRKCIGVTCFQIPEVLTNLEGCFGVHLRAPRTGSMDIATYYMTSFFCEYTRALLERALEGGYQFLDCLITPDGCSMLNRCVENMELLKIKQDPDFFYKYLEVPMKADDNGLFLYVGQCKEKILNPLSEAFEIDVSDEALRRAVYRNNKVCRLINELGDFRKEEKPRITGYEFHIICMATFVAPHDMLLDKLEETLSEVKTREPDEDSAFRARLAVVGSEIDDVDMIAAIEEAGAYVCADRFCFGSLPGRAEIELNDEEDVLTQICRTYMMKTMCPRHMDSPKMQRRMEYVDEIAREYKAEGIIFEQMKFCDPWAYERMVGSNVLRNEYGYPVMTIDRKYVIGSSGQIRTRVQAFVESIEIKRLKADENG
ncbi:MAG: 2-hydroxyacyl-CoA dehydratase [Eggerthellaceae bacterium]|nr:2-hydroxyacyl-CoA dehydratase [Eggerthellaceae bacterium]